VLQLLPELPIAVEDIHPAAIASPEVAQLLQQQQQQLLSPTIQQQDKLQHAAESADTRLLVSALTPMASDDYAEQVRQCTPGPQVVPASPEPQQLDAAQAEAPATGERTAPQPGQSLVLQQPEQQGPVFRKPPVKGCFWHVYIAKMIQTDQHCKEKHQKGKQQQQQRASPIKRSHQQEAAAGAGATAPAKKRRPEQQQLQQQAGKVATAAMTPTGTAGMSAAHQQAAAVQHVLVQTLLRQQSSSAGAGVPALLGQQMPGVLQLLQALTATGGMCSVAQYPASAPTNPLDLLSGLTPALATAAAGCPQLLQALGAAAGGLQAPFAAPAFPAGTSAPSASAAAANTRARPLATVMGSVAQGATAAGFNMGSTPAGAAPNVGLMQAMLGQLPGFVAVPAVAAAPGWPGYRQVSGVLSVTGMQPHVFPGRVAV
jgi:hypothetical protein